ncbi:MAG TPA: dihydrodipicolinate synthase family protein [Acidimicrobiia bacterium]
MLTARDITGLMALPATPVREGADPFAPESTVDVDEAARAAKQLVADGASSIGLCGTTGECATLTWSEKRELYAAVRDAVDGKIPVLAGTTTLGTRDTVEQMRAVRDLGLDGAFVGLPLWQTPTVENAVGFHADLSDAVPDLPVLVYANGFFFKFAYPLEFWEGIAAKAPTVVACKVGFQFTEEIFTAAGHQVNFLHGEGGTLGNAWRSIPQSVTAGWATSAAMGPEPWVAFFRALDRGDAAECERVLSDIEAVPLPIPDFGMFASYNIQLEKARIDAAGYMRCGPPRPPYTDFPDDWQAAAEANARAWRELRAKYGASL